METVGLGLYFEDLPVGRCFRTIGRTVTEADITSFVNCTGMVEVIEARLSRNRPGRGLVRTRNRVVKQDGTVALTYTPLRMIKCRDG
jgi:acyl dehydratase